MGNLGFVERANQNVEYMLYSWLKDNNSTHWSEGLRFVQLIKNRAHHSGINCTPYKTTFGAKLKVGLKSFLPEHVLPNTNCEKDLEAIVEDENNLQSVEESALQNKQRSNYLTELGSSQYNEEDEQPSTSLSEPSSDFYNYAR